MLEVELINARMRPNASKERTLDKNPNMNTTRTRKGLMLEVEWTNARRRKTQPKGSLNPPTPHRQWGKHQYNTAAWHCRTLRLFRLQVWLTISTSLLSGPDKRRIRKYRSSDKKSGWQQIATSRGECLNSEKSRLILGIFLAWPIGRGGVNRAHRRGAKNLRITDSVSKPGRVTQEISGTYQIVANVKMYPLACQDSLSGH